VNGTINERGGRPSASEGKANKLCNGRHKMCLPLKDTASKAASDGTDQHSWMEDNSFELRADLLPACEEAKEQLNHVISLVWGDWTDNPPAVFLEDRLWYRGDRYSGKADYVGIRDKRALIADYKFGRVKVDDAINNEQLVWLAVLVSTNYSVDRVTVAIIQPHCGTPTLHTYNSKDLRRLRNRVLALVRRIDSPHASLRAGAEQCKYCKALHICPAVGGKMDVIARIDERQVTTLTNAHLSGMLDALPAVRKLCDRLEAEAASRLRERPEAITGFELVQGFSSRRIVDAGAAASRLLESGLIDEGGLVSASSIKLGQLQRVVAEYGEISPKEAKKEVARVLGDALAVREGKDKICRIES